MASCPSPPPHPSAEPTVPGCPAGCSCLPSTSAAQEGSWAKAPRQAESGASVPQLSNKDVPGFQKSLKQHQTLPKSLFFLLPFYPSLRSPPRSESCSSPVCAGVLRAWLFLPRAQVLHGSATLQRARGDGSCRMLLTGPSRQWFLGSSQSHRSWTPWTPQGLGRIRQEASDPYGHSKEPEM